MHCYCKAQFLKTKSAKAMDIRFVNETATTDTGNSTKEVYDEKKYCEAWLINYAIENFMVVGTSLVVVVINILASTILTLIVSFEKQHTVNDETMG